MGRHHGNDRRDAQIQKYWERGWTQARIGRKYGIKRQRVHQILQARGADVGGQEIKRAEIARQRAVMLAAKERQRDEECMARWGITRAEYAELRELAEDIQDTPMYRFLNARRTKIRTGIEWELTFPQWWRIWQKSGKYEDYGRGEGKYMLVRKKNRGAYRVGNVVVMPANEFHAMVHNEKS